MEEGRLLGERSPDVILENYSTNGYIVVLTVKKGFTQAHFTSTISNAYLRVR